MERYIVNIYGQEIEGAPTMTPEEVKRAFDAAVAEWPEVRKARDRKYLYASILNALGGEIMEREVSRLYDAADCERNNWEKRHGVISSLWDEKRLLTAWTKEGKIEGPALDMHGPVEDELNLTIKRDKFSPPNSSLEWEEIIINGRSFMSYALFPGEKEAKEAMATELTDWHRENKRLKEIMSRIKKIKSSGEEDRMQYFIRLLYFEKDCIRTGWEMRHEVAEKFIIDDEKCHIVAWTREKMIVGPEIKS